MRKAWLHVTFFVVTTLAIGVGTVGCTSQPSTNVTVANYLAERGIVDGAVFTLDPITDGSTTSTRFLGESPDGLMHTTTFKVHDPLYKTDTRVVLKTPNEHTLNMASGAHESTITISLRPETAEVLYTVSGTIKPANLWTTATDGPQYDAIIKFAGNLEPLLQEYVSKILITWGNA